ncbi:TatD DNase [Kwoniella heveanensis CBS 569]|nr:TatD DNase [Kwoniella heveanensis CBS 569]
MFRGSYHGRTKHAPDLPLVVSRAKEKGVERILITGTSLQESREALELAEEYGLHCTAGCHPTSTSEIAKHPSGEEGYLADLRSLIEQDRGEGGSKRIISIGEVGLDYDRLHHSPKETQLAHLPALLKLSERYRLPLFLHSRTSESHNDLVKTLNEVGWSTAWGGGVVHSFTGTEGEMRELVDMGLYIGVNGCSLKTAANLDVVKQIPLDKLLLETDAPWCSVTASHASHAHLPPSDSPYCIKRVGKPEKFQEGSGVKGRWEPADIGVIAHIVASIRGTPIEELADKVWDNTMRLFYPSER